MPCSKYGSYFDSNEKWDGLIGLTSNSIKYPHAVKIIFR